MISPTKLLSRIFIVLIIAESIYFNISYDLLLLLFLFTTAFALGSTIPIKLRIFDKVLVQLSAGLGIMGFFIWISTMWNFHYKSVYLVLSFIVILVQLKPLSRTLKKLSIAISFNHSKNKLFFLIIGLSFLCYIIPASYPIWQFDALVKHVAIPTYILNHSHWDYNVVETIGNGDYALLSHMYYLYLMALGGIKAPVLFNTVISFLVLFLLVRLSTFVLRNDKWVVNALPLLYLTTPVIYILSTVLYVDILPPFFIMAALLTLLNYRYLPLKAFVYLTTLLLGFAFFAKQMALFFVIPILFITLFILIQTWFQKRLNTRSLLKITAGAASLFCLPFLFPMLFIWSKTGNPIFPFMNGLFKSPYFSSTDFADPFSNSPLGFNFKSLFSVIFHTSKNMELENGGIGYFLLVLLIVPIFWLFKRNKTFLLLSMLTYISYLLSVQLTYNIRYFFGSIILATLICVITVRYLSDYIPYKSMKNLVFSSIIVALIVPNLYFVVDPLHYWTFKKTMIIPKDQLTINANESVLEGINKADVKVLSNNDVFRGTFKGHYYTLSWYNDFLISQLTNNKVSPIEFLTSFDYYLVNNTVPEKYPEYFSLESPEINSLLTLTAQSATHSLYKISKNVSETQILSEHFPIALNVTVSTPEVRTIENIYEQYKIEIDAEKPKGTTGDYYGRWQINWLDNNDQFITTSIVPFKLENERKVYVSSMIADVPAKAKTGVVYMTSHDDKPIIIHDIKVFGIRSQSYLDQLLEEYSSKWPHL
jgi:hypothetical protein